MKLNINDEQGIEILHFIFERELKPPFTRGNRLGHYLYYNRDGEIIGMIPYSGFFSINVTQRNDIGYKVRQLFGYPYNNLEWLYATIPHLKSWMENQINVKLDTIW